MSSSHHDSSSPGNSHDHMRGAAGLQCIKIKEIFDVRMHEIQVLLPRGEGVEQSAMHSGKRIPLLSKISGRTLGADHAGQKACNQLVVHAEFRKLLLD